MLRNLVIIAGSLFFFGSLVLPRNAGAQNSYPDTLWVPVTFYDYWVDTAKTNPDFEIAASSNTLGMVDLRLDSQRKPIPTAIACPAGNPNPPSACHLSEWFRVSGDAGSDNSLIFTGDSTNKLAQRWYWTTSSGSPLPNYLGRPGEFVGPNHKETNTMRNVIIYDSLPFIHLGKQQPSQTGVYEFARGSFFWIDKRGYGEQPAGSGHNFGFAMELHTSFTYRQGLTFTFTGDDDTWAFINGKRVIDLGGRHSPATATISLDTIPGFVDGQQYSIDFFYAERHTTGSAIQITSNIIAAQPTRLSLKVSNDSICAGNTVTVIGSLIDNKGKIYPELSDAIQWSIQPASYRPGDSLSSPINDTTRFTGTEPGRRAGIVASYRMGNQIITNTAWIYVKDCSPLPSLLSATTKDLDGNGYIDHIDLGFSKKTNLTDADKTSMLVQGNGQSFPVERVIKISDNTYRIKLREKPTEAPQTAWTPNLTLVNTKVQPAVNFRTTDGCPPVVWSVKKYVVADSNRTRDTIIVTLSEKISGPSGGIFSTATAPSEVFNVWELQGNAYVKVNTLLTGIKNFAAIISDSILVIAMTNGSDITAGNYFNIMDGKSIFKDRAENYPDAANQKVRVTVAGIVFRVVAGPNPARPTFAHPEPLEFKNEPNALTWAMAGQGTVISLQNLIRPSIPEDAKNVTGFIKIYDVVGNPVIGAETRDLFSGLANSGGTAPSMNIYWNGLNEMNMMVAPGVYRAVIYLSYPTRSKIPSSRVVTKIGIKR